MLIVYAFWWCWTFTWSAFSILHGEKLGGKYQPCYYYNNRVQGMLFVLGYDFYLFCTEISLSPRSLHALGGIRRKQESSVLWRGPENIKPARSQTNWGGKEEREESGFLLFFFRWRIIALQYFVVFCHTWTRIRHRCPHVISHPTPLDGHRVPGWDPCIIHHLPFSYLFYMW